MLHRLDLPSLLPSPRVATAALIATAGFLSGCSEESGQSETRPDILLITIDTVRADAIGCYGRESARTPNIDQLAATGARFQWAFTPRGATLPALTTVLTGVSPLAHGVIGNDHALQTRQPTLAEILRDAGYSTAAILNNQCPTLIKHEEHAGRGFDYKACGKTDDPEQYLWDENAANLAVEWIDAAPDRPAFVWVHFMDPHGGHEPRPELYRGRLPADPLMQDQAAQLAAWEVNDEAPPPDMMEILWALYDAEIEGVDQMVGRVVDAMRARVPGNEPVILLAADHGEEFYEHNHFRGHADSIYDTVLRIPFILAAPGKVEPGTVPHYFAELQDVLPTLTDLAGVKPPVRIEGESLLPYLNEGLDKEFGHGSAISLWSPDILTVRRPRYRYVWNQKPGEQRQPIFTYRERFDFYNQADMLFDVWRDPGEQDNLCAGDEPRPAAIELRRSMRKQLHDWTKHERHLTFQPQIILDEELAEELRQTGYK